VPCLYQVGLFYLDLFVEQAMVVEVKAFSHQLINDERAQVINYLKATECIKYSETTHVRI